MLLKKKHVEVQMEKLPNSVWIWRSQTRISCFRKILKDNWKISPETMRYKEIICEDIASAKKKQPLVGVQSELFSG